MRKGKKELLSTDPYKGVRDFFPEDQAFLNYFLTTAREVVQRFGYVEYHASVLEPSELYKSKGAENEELINEQTYTFLDRGGREVTLRPEMTPTVARMVAARHRDMGYPLRWFSIPNLFRYERSQRGRLREHWQLNVDIFGTDSLAADAEIIAVAHALLTAFGAGSSDFEIRLGSRNFLDELVKKLGLGEEEARELRGLMDRRAKMPHDEFVSGMTLLGVGMEMLTPEKPPHDVATVLELLRGLGIENAVFDPGIVRGFDYYTGVVFEVFDTNPENNRAMLGGGRYDNLAELFGVEHISGAGFGMGDVTLRDFLAVRGLIPDYLPPTKVWIALASPELVAQAMALAEELRRANVNVGVDFGDRKLGKQIDAAVKHKISYLIVVGEDELASGSFKVKDLATGEEKALSREELSSFFTNL